MPSFSRRLRLPALSGSTLGLCLVLALFTLLLWSKDPKYLGDLKSFYSLRNLQVLVQECTVPGSPPWACC